jgi:hypothetical protein
MAKGVDMGKIVEYCDGCMYCKDEVPAFDDSSWCYLYKMKLTVNEANRTPIKHILCNANHSKISTKEEWERASDERRKR